MFLYLCVCVCVKYFLACQNCTNNKSNNNLVTAQQQQQRSMATQSFDVYLTGFYRPSFRCLRKQPSKSNASAKHLFPQLTALAAYLTTTLSPSPSTVVICGLGIFVRMLQRCFDWCQISAVKNSFEDLLLRFRFYFINVTFRFLFSFFLENQSFL